MQRTILVLIIIVVLIAVILGIYFLFASPNSGGIGINPGSNYDAKGVKVEILKQGSGVQAKSGDNVIVDYVGTLQNGKKFDSSIDRNAPFAFTLSKSSVIKGFDSGILGMRVGERRKLTIPPELGYSSANLALIPPNSTLIYEVELLRINNSK